MNIAAEKIQMQDKKDIERWFYMIIDKKMIAIVGLVMICFVLIYATFVNWSGKNELKGVNAKLLKEQMKANYDLGKAETGFVDEKQQKEQLKQNIDQVIQKWMTDNNASATDIGILRGQLTSVMTGGSGGKIQIVTMPGKDTNTIIHSGATGSCEIPIVTTVDSVNSLGKYIWLDLNGDGIPDTKTSKIVLTYKDYHIDISVDALTNVFNYSLHQNFKGEFVKAITKEGGVVHFIKINEVDDKGNKVNEIKITDFKVTTVDESKGKKHFYWWNPQLDLGANINLSNRLSASVGPEIGLSTSGYGKTEDDNDWRLFRFSIGKNGDKVMGNFSPGCWNAGKALPLVKDLLLCPTVGYSNSTTLYGISVGNTF